MGCRRTIMRGYLYVLSNKAMPNLLKIGFTTRTVEERIQELSSTGVPGRFDAEFFCEVNDAPRYERAVHSRLSKHRYGKEFFECGVAVAVRTAKEALIENGLVLISTGGRSRDIYLTPEETAAIQRAAKQIAEEREQIANEEKRRADTERLEKEAHQEVLRILEQQFMRLAPLVCRVIRQHESKHPTLKAIGSFALICTFVGAPLADILDPPAFDDGRRTAKKLTAKEVAPVHALIGVLQELRALNATAQIFEKYYNSTKPEDRHLVWYRNGKYDLSDWVAGVISGL
jgi:hypothetical protein